jgi:hypothetical protein
MSPFFTPTDHKNWIVDWLFFIGHPLTVAAMLVVSQYCNMTPESWNNGARRNRPLCGDGLVNVLLWQQICTQQ